MKPLVQKLQRQENTSFVVKSFHTPYFEMGWCQHIEYELIYFTEGSGDAFIGKHEGKFQAGDIYFLGNNLPHAFQKNGEQPLSALVIQFRDNCFGPHFFNIPECIVIKQLLNIAGRGLLIKGNNQYRLQHMITSLETATDFIRINLLLHCLHMMSLEKEYITLTTNNEPGKNYKDSESIDKVIEFTLDSFQDHISLSQAAVIACMSIPSFCLYFKQRIGKTYIDYLNEVRINHACRQLLQTNKCVTEICYESGYNTIVHFHRQFFKLKKTTPLQYRKQGNAYNRFSVPHLPAA